MEITNPKRILLLSQSGIDYTPVLEALITDPTSKLKSTAQTISNTTTSSPNSELIHSIKTQYYTANIPIWTDTINDPSSWIEEWKSSVGAGDVINALGAVVLVFDVQGNVDNNRDLLRGIAGVISWHQRQQNESGRNAYASLGIDQTEDQGEQELKDEGINDDEALANWDGVLLAVGQRSTKDGDSDPVWTREASSQDEDENGNWDPDWEDVCLQAGRWEYIDAAAAEGLNDYGELQGLPRLIQALEAVEWDAAESREHGESDDELDGLDEDIEAMLLSGSHIGAKDYIATGSQSGIPSGIDGDIEIQRELQRMIGLSSQDMQAPILAAEKTTNSTASKYQLEDGDENDVDALQTMLIKLQAARDLGADASQAQRRRLAAQAVKQVLGM